MDLKGLNVEQRETIAKKFIEEVILKQWVELQQWHNLTMQTSQIDFGYLSQHLVTILSGIPGKGQRGKGDDLSDGSEVKSASCLSAMDTPRWNNVNCGMKSQKDLKEKLNSVPYFFFVLIDTTERGGDILRCRAWAVRPAKDKHFRKVLLDWARDNDKKGGAKTNLQLHPPRWEKGEENITTNEFGNLKLPLFYHSEQLPIQGIYVMETLLYKPNIIKENFCQKSPRT